jgi:hypothetical protein
MKTRKTRLSAMKCKAVIEKLRFAAALTKAQLKKPGYGDTRIADDLLREIEYRISLAKGGRC